MKCFATGLHSICRDKTHGKRIARRRSCIRISRTTRRDKLFFILGIRINHSLSLFLSLWKRYQRGAKAADMYLKLLNTSFNIQRARRSYAPRAVIHLIKGELILAYIPGIFYLSSHFPFFILLSCFFSSVASFQGGSMYEWGRRHYDFNPKLGAFQFSDEKRTQYSSARNGTALCILIA